MPPSEVLLVEDDADLADVAALVLEQAGFRVATAHDGLEALKRVDEHMPALILLDMLMPVMDGWQFAREFRSRHGSAAPIVVVTAAEHARERADEIAADDVVPKPFDVEHLIRVARRFAGPGDRPSA